MASSLRIDSVANLHTGDQAQVTLSGVPTGALRFWASRTHKRENLVLLSATGSGPYTVTLPHAGLWWFWAEDANGFTPETDAQGEPDAPACFVGISDDALVEEIGIYLRDALYQSKPGIEAILRQKYPETTIKQVHFGYPSAVIQWPSIIVTNPRWRWEWQAMPYVKHYTYSFTIACLVVHDDETSEMDFAAAFAYAVGLILNQPAYHDITLPSGIQLYFCQAQEGDAQEVQLSENLTGSVGSQVWSGKAQLQDTGS